jgi:hypothetical protein
MTKPCKSCKEQIDELASKCPKCQAFQKWYKSPQILSLIFTLPLLGLVFWNTSKLTEHDTFANNKEKLTATIASEADDAMLPDASKLLTIRIDNKSEKTWKHPTFQIENLNDKGVVNTVEHVSDFNVIVSPHSSTLVTIPIRIHSKTPPSSRRVTLTDMDSGRF